MKKRDFNAPERPIDRVQRVAAAVVPPSPVRSVKLPEAAEDRRKAYTQKSLHEAKPNSLPSDARKIKDVATCKPRPKPTEKARGGGNGASRRFVPWCS